jgi:hypothetical protein
MVQLSRLGCNGRLLAGEPASLLCCPMLSVGPLSVDSSSLPLLIGLLSLRRKLGFRLWYDGP